ncbi:MAG: hypothetical protein NUV82_03950 [Candidatus Komeilibacteria bacterium]|nr:hypothetical protein [Candidatus Komeilibacteria bacterium]
MKTITKIGKDALTKYFSKKPAFMKELREKWFTEVIFSKKPIDLSTSLDTDFEQKLPTNYSFYKMWSIEIGMLSLELKKDQTLLKGISKKLNKLQKEDGPSHIIAGERITRNCTIPEVTTTYTIYRLTEDQELEIYFDYLLPSITKRNKKLRENLEQSRWAEEKSLQEFEELDS